MGQEKVYNDIVGVYVEKSKNFPKTVAVVAERLDGCGGEQELVFLKDGIDLSRRNLRYVSINNIKLKNVDFSYSDLTGADFNLVVFENCNFSHAIRTGSKGHWVKYENCKFDDAVSSSKTYKSFPVLESFNNWNSVDPGLFDKTAKDSSSSTYSLLVTDFDRLPFTPAYPLTRVQFKKTINYKDKVFHNVAISPQGYPVVESMRANPEFSYSELDFSNATFLSCILVAGVDFKKDNFENATFIDSTLEGDFTDANFENAKFINTSITQNAKISKKQIESTWNWKNKRMDKFPEETLKVIRNSRN